MRFFLDQCVPRSIGDFVEKENHEVLILKDYLATDARDELVIQKAQTQNAILLSLNGDFSEIVKYPPNKFKGIIGLQVKNRPEAIPHILNRLRSYLQPYPQQEHYVGKLILVEPHRIRIR